MFFELMKTTITISANLHASPFEVMKEDLEDVIMLINFYIMLGDEKAEAEEKPADNFWDM